ncbi:hypothetical protein K491DRAFT_781326 [Lophiostoma macrostomum CBS 122681]|uniref:Uncharacterized protein n=1 Tax=Lophiostoma macrostomum CBS 122681 TaxID=1314788 RepID=A0A6A6SWI8_9PLEO|nr:hypothetical protein K491DRAFT_781326 [Lophiostoma macrostomum CBS 122681]
MSTSENVIESTDNSLGFEKCEEPTEMDKDQGTGVLTKLEKEEENREEREEFRSRGKNARQQARKEHNKHLSTVAELDEGNKEVDTLEDQKVAGSPPTYDNKTSMQDPSSSDNSTPVTTKSVVPEIKIRASTNDNHNEKASSLAPQPRDPESLRAPPSPKRDPNYERDYSPSDNETTDSGKAPT